MQYQEAAVYNAHIDNSDDMMADDSHYKYLLVFSSKKCPHCKELIMKLSENKLPDAIQDNLTPLDVIAHYKNQEPIPDYIEGVPALIISDEFTNEVEQILYGEDVFKWVSKHLPRKTMQEVGGHVGVGSYTQTGWQPPAVQMDKYGKPIPGDNPFQENMDHTSKKINDTDVAAQMQQWQEESNGLGLVNNTLIGAEGGPVGDADPDIGEVVRAGGGGGYGAPVAAGTKKKKKKSRLSSYNS